MHGQNLVAVYPSRSQAEAARSRLLDSGIAENDIRLSADQQGSAASSATPKQKGGFLDWLFGADVPDAHQTWYGSNLRDGRTALSVYLRGDSPLRIHDMLEEFDPIDVEEVEEEGLEPTAQSGIAVSSTSQGMKDAGSEKDQIIPVAKEELEIGKRETERRYRIRTYVVEHPVEEQVHLRDERVVVERRSASGERAAGDDQFQERDFEVVERHQEPVVGKKARADEQVVVHKQVKDRVETVRDTVRETKVDIDKDQGSAGQASVQIDGAAAGNKPEAATGPIGTESVGKRVSDNAEGKG
jgi:stress response protein YsnF